MTRNRREIQTHEHSSNSLKDEVKSDPVKMIIRVKGKTLESENQNAIPSESWIWYTGIKTYIILKSSFILPRPQFLKFYEILQKCLEQLINRDKHKVGK